MAAEGDVLMPIEEISDAAKLYCMAPIADLYRALYGRVAERVYWTDQVEKTLTAVFNCIERHP